MDEKERKRLGCTSDRDKILPDGRINHVLEVQNVRIDGNIIIERFKERLKSKEEKSG